MKKVIFIFITLYSFSIFSMTTDEIVSCGAPQELVGTFVDDAEFVDYLSRIFKTTKDNQVFHDEAFEKIQSLMDAKAEFFESCQDVYLYISNVSRLILQANQEMDEVKNRFEDKFREL